MGEVGFSIRGYGIALPYKDYRAFFENLLLGLCACIRHHPDKIAGRQLNSAKCSVPAFGWIAGLKHEFTIPVINRQAKCSNIAGMQRPEHVIVTIAIGGECIGQFNIAAARHKIDC